MDQYIVTIVTKPVRGSSAGVQTDQQADGRALPDLRSGSDCVPASLTSFLKLEGQEYVWFIAIYRSIILRDSEPGRALSKDPWRWQMPVQY